jgi:DNA-binding response OmpR family regulator
MRILIADDNADAADALAATLESSGHDVIRAYAGEEALRLALAHQPDAIVLDASMPGISGLDVCRTIRDTNWGRACAIAILSGWSGHQIRRDARAAGVDMFFVKPLGSIELVEWLKAVESGAAAVHPATDPPPRHALPTPPDSERAGVVPAVPAAGASEQQGREIAKVATRQGRTKTQSRQDR